jgi:hypothetical protein
MLYFYFLKSMAIMFLVLSVCPGTVQIMMNLAGNFLAAYSDLDAVSLANFGLQSSNNNSASLNVQLPTTNNGK